MTSVERDREREGEKEGDGGGGGEECLKLMKLGGGGEVAANEGEYWELVN